MLKHSTLIIISIFLVSLKLLGCTSSVDKEISALKSTNPVAKVSAQEIFKEFYTNQNAATEKYKENIVEVKGAIGRIGTNIKGDIYVSLIGDPSVGFVQSYFLGQFNEKASQLKVGQVVTVRGRCTGFLMNVVLDRSILIES